MFDLRSDAGIDAAYRAYGAGLHALARRVLDDLGLAEEAVQETFVRAWRSAHTFDAGNGSQKGWLYAICRNTSVDLYRHRRIRPAVVAHPDAGERHEPVAVDELDRAVRGWVLEEALRRLAPEHRYVLIAAHLEGRAYDDLARELGVPIGTVKSRVFYGLRSLRTTLTAMGWDDGPAVIANGVFTSALPPVTSRRTARALPRPARRTAAAMRDATPVPH